MITAMVKKNGIESLPKDCISNIISFTNPRDACIAACVSKSFESAVNSDIVWEKFLPTEYPALVSPSQHFSSKKDIYLSLSDYPLLIEDGTKSFWLEKASGKKCFMLSAKNISIIWGDTLEKWKWIQIPEARFERVAELLKVCWLEIRGRIHTSFLSPITLYSAYIVFKKANRFYGFEDVEIEAEVGVVGDEPSRRSICFDTRSGRTRRDNLVIPKQRGDGWIEIELGEFFNEGGVMNPNEEIQMSALEIKQLNWKHGLIIQGIEIRPSKIYE